MKSDNQQPPSIEPTSNTTTITTTHSSNPFTKFAAWGIAVLGPIALFLPGRGGATKSTFQNAILAGSTFWGYNTLAAEYTGKSITQRSSERWRSLLGLPEKKPEEEKRKKGGVFADLPTERAAQVKMLLEEERRRRAAAEGREYKPKDTRGFWERVWMGNEEEGWKEKRLEEERKALESGKGYGDLIIEQVKEVFGKRDNGKKE